MAATPLRLDLKPDDHSPMARAYRARNLYEEEELQLALEEMPVSTRKRLKEIANNDFLRPIRYDTRRFTDRHRVELVIFGCEVLVALQLLPAFYSPGQSAWVEGEIRRLHALAERLSEGHLDNHDVAFLGHLNGGASSMWKMKLAVNLNAVREA